MNTLKIKTLLIALVVGVCGFSVFATQQVSAADNASKQEACVAIGLSPNCNPQETDDGINTLIATAVNILSWVVGIAAVIMIIIGGFKYVTSNGDSNAISSAKSTIIYALVGLVIVAIAQLLVRFVIKQF